MNKRTTLMPVMLVAIISVLALIAIVSGRSNDTGLTPDRAYPYHICTMAKYCVGSACTRSPQSFVAYLEHEDGAPLVEMAGINPRATLERTSNGLVFETRGGSITGTLTIFNDRALDWVGASGEGNDVVEHFASGSCERLQQP